MFDPIRNMSEMVTSANEENSWALEAILSCNEELTDEAMEAITAAGKKLKELKSEMSVQEILTGFIKGMKAAGVKFADSAMAGKKLYNYIRRKDLLIGQSTSMGLAKTYADMTIDGVPVVVYGSTNHLKRKFWVPVLKPNGKVKVVTISSRQMAKMYNDDNTGLDQEKVKVYGKKLLKYVAETNPEADDLANVDDAEAKA